MSPQTSSVFFFSDLISYSLCLSYTDCCPGNIPGILLSRSLACNCFFCMCFPSRHHRSGSFVSSWISYLPLSHCDFHGPSYLKLQYTPFHTFFFLVPVVYLKVTPRNAEREWESETRKGEDLKEYVRRPLP